MNTLLSLLLLVAARVDGVCISYDDSDASGSCIATETNNQDNCCGNFSTEVGSFNFRVDGGEMKQCDCCCSSCPANDALCVESIGEDATNPSDTECSTDDDCAGLPAADCCGYSCDGGTCSAMSCEFNQCQQCTPTDPPTDQPPVDCPTPSDESCFYTCNDFSGDYKCMLACSGGGLPPPTVTCPAGCVATARRSRARRLLFSTIPADLQCGPGCEPEAM